MTEVRPVAAAPQRSAPQPVKAGSAAPERDAGSGVVWVLAVTAVAVMVMGLIGAVGAAVTARHRAESAADLAALAAASLAAPAVPPAPAGGAGADSPDGAARSAACARATSVAAAVGARLSDCRPLADGSVLVGVSVPVRLAWLGPVEAKARARAGRRSADAAPGLEPPGR
jgi:hypothetical protein